MQMIPRTVPRSTHIADHFALPHPLASCDGNGGTVRVQRLYPASVVQFNVVAIASTPRVGAVGNGHHAGGGRKDGRARRSGDIRTAVVCHLSGEWVFPVTKRRSDRKTLWKRPREYVRPHPIGMPPYPICRTEKQSV